MSNDGLENTCNMADTIEATAAAWLRHRQWDWNAECEAEFNAWLTESWSHRVAFWRLEAAWNRAERLTALRLNVIASPSRSLTEKKRPHLLKTIASVGAAVLVGLSAMWWMSRPVERTYSTAIGDRRTITLSDGSRIELNTDTVLRVSMGSKERTAFLDGGEAYFQIKHDPSKPFVVIADNHRITDLGTKFVVRDDPDHFKIALLDGRVRLDTVGEPKQSGILLKPGQELTSTARSTSTEYKSTEELSNELGWKRGMLIFENVSLADVASEFNRYNSKKLIIADAAAAHRTIGASFPTGNVDLFAQMARDVLHLHVEDRGTEIVISR